MAGNSYYYRKLHSLLGIIPVGMFLIFHLVSNYAAFEKGHEGFIQQVELINSLPFVLALEIFGIYLPLLYHGVYGLYMAYTSRNNVSNYGYFRNVMFMLQRVTGVITLLFVVWHVFETRVQVALGIISHDELGVRMHEIATQPWALALYIIAIVAAVFHFSNGIWSFLVSWGITVGPRAQQISGYICMIFFVVLSVIGVLAITAFTGAEFQDTSVLNH